jgi:hypothetical protein
VAARIAAAYGNVGSSSFARHAFNELVSFIAPWGQMLNYVITVADFGLLRAPLPGVFWSCPGDSPGGVIGGAALILALVLINALTGVSAPLNWQSRRAKFASTKQFRRLTGRCPETAARGPSGNPPQSPPPTSAPRARRSTGTSPAARPARPRPIAGTVGEAEILEQGSMFRPKGIKLSTTLGEHR